MDERPLPTVIGPTENALRALLLSVLDPSEIAGYEEWAYLNMASGGASTDAIAAALGVAAETVEEVTVRLAGRGLVDSSGSVSPRGHTELRHARARVADATNMITRGIDPSELAVAVRVLDLVRANAQRELASSSHGDNPLVS
jgi:predicted ArsR family transcriptional regulator